MKKKAYNIIIAILAIFPILPFKIKGLSVVLFLILSLISLRKRDLKMKGVFFLNACLFVMYALSITYSENISDAFKILETKLSLLIFPLSFVLLSANSNAVSSVLKFEEPLKKLFLLSSFVLCVIIFIVSLQYGNYYEQKIALQPFLDNLNTGFYWLVDHPIYLSIYISIALLILIHLYASANRNNKIALLIIGLFKLFILLLLSRKGVIIAFSLSASVYVFLKQRKKANIILLITTVFLVSIPMVNKFMPDTTKRFQEMFDSKSYKKEVDPHSSTSIRYAIYTCALEKISDSWLVGYGLGDVKPELDSCYGNISSHLLEINYNSHNQYLDVLLTVGLIGFILFLISLFINLRICFINKDYFAFCLILMFMIFMITENILDRQNGVILFAFFINFFFFKNMNESRLTPTEESNLSKQTI